ncbi:hypothetical protein D3C80_1545290 [compost metagenome]
MHNGRAQRLHPCPAAQRLDVHHLLIVEHQPAHPITGLQGDPCRQRGKLGSGDRLETAPGAEVHVHALIDQQQRWPVALFGEGAHERLAIAQRSAPVEVAQIIAGDVTAKLVETQAPAPQAGGMIARQDARQRLTRQKTQTSHAVFEGHQLAQRGVDETVLGRLHGLAPLRPGWRRCPAAGRSPGRLRCHRRPRRRRAAGDGAIPGG